MGNSYDEEIALVIAIKAGVLRECEVHQYTIRGSMDYERAYRLANKLITLKDPLVEQCYGDRRRLTDALKKVINYNAITCPGCEGLIKENC